MEEVCFRAVSFGRTPVMDYIAVATNGRIRTSSETSGCSVPLTDQTNKNVVPPFCQKGTEAKIPLRGEDAVMTPVNTDFTSAESHTFFFVILSDIPKIDLIPGKSASLQCALITFGRTRGCKSLRLRWLDEAEAEIQSDSEHRIQRHSSCNVTLTVSFKSPGTKKLKCRATQLLPSRPWEQLRASVELWVKVPGIYL